MQTKYLLPLFISSITSLPANSDITVEQHLNFGRIAILDNSVVSTLSILSNGTIVADPNFIILEPGQNGRYLLHNFTPSTQLSISLSGGSTASDFAGSPPPTDFSIEPYLDFATYNTDALGELTLNLPGVLRTSGDSNTYIDGTYYRYFQIYVNY